MSRLARWSKLAWTVLSCTAEVAYRLTLMLTMLTFLGSMGLFMTLFLLFCRYLPTVAIAEVKGVLPHHHHGPHPEGHGTPKPATEVTT